MKCTQPTLLINRKLFYIVPEVCVSVDVVFYKCYETQQEVRVRWNKQFQYFDILGTGEYKISTADLSRNLFMKEEKISHFLNDRQQKNLDALLTDVLLSIEQKGGLAA